MAVYRRSYKPYAGTVTPEWSRFLALFRYSRKSVFRSKVQTGLFVMSQGDGESKRHGHGPAPEYKGETATHTMTMPRFYMVAQLKYTGTEFTKLTSRVRRKVHIPPHHVVECVLTHRQPLEGRSCRLNRRCRQLPTTGKFQLASY